MIWSVSGSAGNPDRPQRRVLLVDDDPTLLTTLVDLFEDAGYEVHTATDGLAALTSLRRSIPDAVVADVRMPGLSGDRLAAELADWGLPIVLTSGYARTVSVPGATFIPKPFETDDLVSTVGLLIDSAARERAQRTDASRRRPRRTIRREPHGSPDR